MQRRTIQSLFALAVLCLAAAAPARAADDDKGKKVDGTWTWSITTQNGQSFDAKLRLKQEGEKLTGAMIGRNNNETEIKDGKISSDGEVTFNVTRERNGQSTTTKYKGKLQGDEIKGTMEREGGQARDWVAKRAKDEK